MTHPAAAPSAVEIAHFRAFGFVVLRGAVPAAPLREEIELVVGRGAGGIDTGVATTRYAPMMTSSRTPTSLGLLDAFAEAAAAFVGGAVLPVRAKGMRYFGSTGWHADSNRPISTVGFLAYLDPLTEGAGALRVLPGSHRKDHGDAVAAFVADAGAGQGIDALPGVPLPTAPGDVIVMDEHLWHASAGGAERLQWRADYVRAPASDVEAREARAFFEQLFSPEWDGGYDPDEAPTYDDAWQASGRPYAAALRALGVYELAARQEAAMRARRPVT